MENQESENEENQEEKKDTVTNEVILSGYVCKNLFTDKHHLIEKLQIYY